MAEVEFIEDGHIYKDNTGLQYVSTTTVITKYKQPFDSEYWSLYKAIQRIVIEKMGEDYFNQIKREIGYEYIIPHFLPKVQTPGLIENKVNEILNEWRIKKEEACAKGTEFHKKKEDETNGQVICLERSLPVLSHKKREIADIWKIDNGVYAEFTVWNEEYIIAGQADKVVIEDEWIDVDDYKTSKFIEEKSFKHYIRGHQMMKAPLDHLMDCNLIHYTLQLSVYGWMIEKKTGKKVRDLRVYHQRKDKWIKVPYLKDEVEMMLKDFRNK